MGQSFIETETVAKDKEQIVLLEKFQCLLMVQPTHPVIFSGRKPARLTYRFIG